MCAAHITGMPTAEHILLESDFYQVPDVRTARKVHARVAFRSRLRGRFTQLEIIDYYYLSVRAHSRSSILEYVLDLRFVDIPHVSRHIAWRWTTASLLLTSTAYAVVQLGPISPAGLQRHWAALYALVAAGWLVSTAVAVYRTTESLTLLSTDGGARLLECTGGLGTLRRLRHFMAKVAAHVRLAGTARRCTKAAHLRDAMREHTRLKQLGVLREPDYESAKARILDRHFGSPAQSETRGAARSAGDPRVRR